MPLPASWVDHLFSRLSVRYGAAFLRQWPDADPAVVKADWAEILAGFDGPSLSYGMRYLPVTPPNALQFRDICRRAPPPEVKRIAAPEVPADPERVKAIMSRLADAPKAESLASICAENIRRAVAARGGAMSGAQRMQLAAIERMTGGNSQVMGEFTPVPAKFLPPGMLEKVAA